MKEVMQITEKEKQVENEMKDLQSKLQHAEM